MIIQKNETTIKCNLFGPDEKKDIKTDVELK
jgi:hypothetical protein